MERDRIIERQAEGIAIAKAEVTGKSTATVTKVKKILAKQGY